MESRDTLGKAYTILDDNKVVSDESDSESVRPDKDDDELASMATRLLCLDDMEFLIPIPDVWKAKQFPPEIADSIFRCAPFYNITDMITKDDMSDRQIIAAALLLRTLPMDLSLFSQPSKVELLRSIVVIFRAPEIMHKIRGKSIASESIGELIRDVMCNAIAPVRSTPLAPPGELQSEHWARESACRDMPTSKGVERATRMRNARGRRSRDQDQCLHTTVPRPPGNGEE